jgi:PhzF family phenazine biosynthesis protein
MKKKILVFQADAFTDKPFHGNPAAVCPLDEWLPDLTMQLIAKENNLAETAFIVPFEDAFQIRWFTPSTEVDLCGHATLASAYIYFNVLGYAKNPLRFFSRSGWLTVTREESGKFTLDFPADPPAIVEAPDENIFKGLGIKPVAVYKGKFDFLVELGTEEEVSGLKPDFKTLSTLDSRGLIATSRGNDVDFVSRCFFPQSGIDEDPVTGSAHCMLTSYWHMKTGRTTFSAIQLSERRGWLDCRLSGDRVLMSGDAVLFLKGEIMIDDK